MSFYDTVYEVTKKMQENAMGNLVYNLLDRCYLRYGINRYQMWKIRNRKHELDTDASKKFFEENAMRVAKNEKMLDSEKSRQIYRAIIRYRCTERYEDLPSNSFHTQYFGNDFFKYQDNEVFIDCGAFTGDTISIFKRLMRRKRIKDYTIIGFEPDSKNIVKLKDNHADVIVMPYGVWKEDATLCFNSEGSRTTVVENNEIAVSRVPVVAIDNVKECKNATFIKMDIEGSEYEALLGAEQTIMRNKPKLAICIYHSNEDMVRLQELIHNMVPDYKFAVRHHTNAMSETVLYCYL